MGLFQVSRVLMMPWNFGRMLLEVIAWILGGRVPGSDLCGLITKTRMPHKA